MSKQYELDDLDKKILSILMSNAKTTYAEIAKKLFVSAGTIHVRMNKLSNIGIVTGSQLTVNEAILGYDICAYIGVYLDKSSMYEGVADALTEIPEIIEAHYTTGLYNIFAKIICKDTKHLRTVLHEKIQNIQGIQRTETFISLEKAIYRPINLLKIP
jgi:Lrp/AsnC family transcriptional regulator for asnA, asnC and gidA